jgi:TonB family protein
MNFLPNILLTNLFLMLIWGTYELFLSKVRYFQANRFFLLGGSVLAVFLPWLPWQINIPTHTESILGLTFNSAQETLLTPSLSTAAGMSAVIPDPFNWIGFIYFLIVSLLFLVTAAQLVRLFAWTKKYPVKVWKNNRIVIIKKPWSVFSFFRTIFYPEPFEPDTKETRTILAHEQIHARQLHSVDNLVIQMIRIFFFYNPAIYLIAGRLRLTHEYIADALTSGCDKSEYSHTLISHQFMVPRLILMHPFNTKSFLKRRLTMLSKTQQNSLAGWKYLLVAPLIGGMILLSGWSASAQNQDDLKKTKLKKEVVAKLKELGFTETSERTWSKDGITVRLTEGQSVEDPKVNINTTEKADDKNMTTISFKPAQVKDTLSAKRKTKENNYQVFQVVEDMPEFQGGTIETFKSWVQANVKYPTMAMENKISGTVYVKFVVNEKGNVQDINIIRSVDPILDDEVVRAMKSAPAWKPGYQKGQPVNVSFSIPVRFVLN